MEGPSTGVGRYLQGLFQGLQEWNHGAQWHLFFQRETPAAAPRAPGFFRHCSEYGGSAVVWEQIVLPRELARHDLDVVFCPAYSVPPRLRTPSVVTMHDLSFEVVPREFSFRERWRRRILARRAVRRATRVLVDTAHMAALVQERYRVAADRLAVVPLGIDRRHFSARREGSDQATLDRLGVQPPFFLWLGTVLERRAPKEVLEAFSRLRRRRPDVGLVMAGANRLRSPERLSGWIRELGLEPHVQLLGWVEEGAVGALYRGAEAGIYVSRHEGYGIPPLECLACGTPVVVSGGLALDTAWPDYPFRSEELTPDSLEKVMAAAVDPGSWNTEISAAAAEVLDGLDWASSSKSLAAELEGAVAV
jgi:glycosyltransferase involved in cell wall biosynthesis